jgi:hypothetical protein
LKFDFSDFSRPLTESSMNWSIAIGHFGLVAALAVAAACERHARIWLLKSAALNEDDEDTDAADAQEPTKNIVTTKRRVAMAECCGCYNYWPKNEMLKSTRVRPRLGPIRFYGNNRSSAGIYFKTTTTWLCPECVAEQRANAREDARAWGPAENVSWNTILVVWIVAVIVLVLYASTSR